MKLIFSTLICMVCCDCKWAIILEWEACPVRFTYAFKALKLVVVGALSTNSSWESSNLIIPLLVKHCTVESFHTSLYFYMNWTTHIYRKLIAVGAELLVGIVCKKLKHKFANYYNFSHSAMFTTLSKLDSQNWSHDLGNISRWIFCYNINKILCV